MGCNIPIPSHSHQFVPISNPIPMVPTILIPIPVPLPNFLPIPSHSHSRLTNERHLPLNNQTMISTELYGRMLQGTNVTVFYWLAFASSQPMGILAHMKKSHSHSHRHVYSFHSHSHFWHIYVPIPMGFPWEFHGNGNPIPMHVSTADHIGLHVYIGWQWRNSFISYLCQLFFRHVVGQALRIVSYSDITFLVR